MRETTRKALSGLMVLAAAGGITAGIADAAKSKKDDNTSRKAKRPAPPAELTGEAAEKARAAALEAVPGGAVRHAFRAPDGGPDPDAAYVVFVEKDGPVLVLLDDDFKLVRTLDRPPHRGPGGPGGPHGGPPHGAELTGEAADKAKAAALEAVPGGTVMRAFEEDGAEGTDAAYEVHVRRENGRGAKVLLDEDFKVIRTVAFRAPCGPGGPGGHHGPPPAI